MDLVWLAAGVVFFLACGGIVMFFQRLRGEE
jgi:hypothetical protein